MADGNLDANMARDLAQAKAEQVSPLDKDLKPEVLAKLKTNLQTFAPHVSIAAENFKSAIPADVITNGDLSMLSGKFDLLDRAYLTFKSGNTD